VRETDGEGAPADAIASLAPNPGAVPGEVLDMSSVLPVPGVSKESNTGDFVLETRTEPADNVVHDSSALRVATSDDHTAALSFVERGHAFAYGRRICASRADVGGQRRCVEDGKGPHSRQLRSQSGLKLRPYNCPLSVISFTLIGLKTYEWRQLGGPSSENEAVRTRLSLVVGAGYQLLHIFRWGSGR
jgi:hypothetical protein